MPAAWWSRTWPALARALQAGAPDAPDSAAPADPAAAAGLTVHRRRAMTQAPPSFAALLPWVDYLPDEQALLLEDGISRGALYELSPSATEGRSDAFLLRQADAVRAALTGVFPELDHGEWVLQVFVQDEPDLDDLAEQLQAYIRPEIAATDYTRDYLARLRRHLRQVARRDGLFVDTEVSGLGFRGQRRRVRAALYRRAVPQQDRRRDEFGPAEQLKNLCDRFEAALRQAGIGLRRLDGRAFYDWLLPWFNPCAGGAGDAPALRRTAPYPGDDELPFGRDFAELLLLAMPRSDAEQGLWYFDGLPHRALTLQQLRSKPRVGHLSAERTFDDGKCRALLDQLPDGAVLSFSITLRAQDRLRNHVDAIEHAAAGDSAEAELTRENCAAVRRRMARGDKLLPVHLVLYLRGRDELDLRRKANAVNAALLPAGLKFIERRHDLLALDAYVRGLPMAFDPAFDLAHLKRSRLMFASDVARLLPLYGRARGTGRPGMLYFNRGGEPLLFDPLHAADRRKNGHMLILGPTGAGKSADCNHKLMTQMAVHRPRLFIVEAGQSFRLLGEHFRRQGLRVHQVTLNADADVSLPPFADAYRLLDARDADPATPVQADDDAADDDTGADAQADAHANERRDILGELEIAARIMVTGGDEREHAKLTRADRYLIRRAILEAARAARDAGRPQLLTEDVAARLQQMAQEADLPPPRRLRALEMGDGMRLFCDGLGGRLFNRPGQPWPDADVTLLEMGVLAREGYEDLLTVAYLSFMNHVNALVEAHQHEARQTIVLTDEAHIVTTNPLLAPYVVKITKMWRKYGTWLWLATQNMGDFPDAARRMLNMMEWWVCLTLPPDEVEQLKRFRELPPETVRLLLGARKDPGKFTEGVVLSDQVEALFRSVPPALPLALAMTEKHEKAQRAQIMRERGCSELEAAYAVAALIEAQRG